MVYQGQRAVVFILLLCHMLCCCIHVTALQSTMVTVAWLVSEEKHHDVSKASSVGALALAVSKATNLTGDVYNITWADPSCNKKQSVIALYKILIEQQFIPDLLLGPQCSSAMTQVGQLAGFRNLPSFGWVSENYELRPDTYTYNTLIRVYPPMNAISAGLVMTLNLFSWKWVFVISSDSSISSDSHYYDLGEVVIKALNGNSQFNVVHYISLVQSPPDDATIKEIFTAAKKEARILILCIPFAEISDWMRVAYDLGMAKGDYAFIFINALVPSPSLYREMTKPGFWRQGTSSDSLIEAGLQSMFILTMKPEDSSLLKQFLQDTSSQAAVNSHLVNYLNVTLEPSDFYAPYLHDAFLLYSKLSVEARNIGCGLNNGTCILERARNRKFTEPELVTGNIILDSMGDRVPEFLLLDLNRSPQFHVVLNTSVDIRNGEIISEMSEVEEIIWGNGKTGLKNRPPDIPECGFQNEKCPNLGLYIGVPLAVVVLIALIVAAVFLFRRYHFEQTIKNMAWKIDRKDLHLTNGPEAVRNMSVASVRGQHRGSFSSLKNSHHHMSAKEADCISIITNDNDQIFISTAKYRNTTVAVKKMINTRLTFDRKLLIEMTEMTDLKHNNLATFIGATMEPPEFFEVWEYCSKGSLQDIIWNEAIKLDNMFKFSIIIDVLTGLKYLHDSHLKMHGKLKSSNVVVDGRWVCKLTDYGLFKFREGQQQPDLDAGEQKFYSHLFWMAPELLRELNEGRKISTSSVLLVKGANKRQVVPMSQEGDLYASAIIIKEVVTRSGPYSEYEDMTPKEIINQVRNDGHAFVTFRPKLPELLDKDLNKIMAVIKSGWSEKMSDRPTAAHMLKELQRINPFKSANVMDNMIRIMERYSNNLEEVVSERTQQVEEEKKKSENLLYRMLPQPVAEKLKFGEKVEAEAFDSVTIYFSDIVKFTNLSAESTPLQVVTLLNGLYTLFDSTCSRHDVYKVETIGDAYMLVSGLPVRNGDRHAVEIANCALELLSGVLNFKVEHKPEYKLQIRIGLHTGPAVSGIVGLTMPRYCLFGSTVSQASLMESGGMPLRIHLSETTYQLLSKFSGYRLALKGSTIDMKGIGLIKSYWLYGRDDFDGPLPDFDELSAEDKPKPEIISATSGEGKEFPNTSKRVIPTISSVAKVENTDQSLSSELDGNRMKPSDRCLPMTEKLQDSTNKRSISESKSLVNLPLPLLKDRTLENFGPAVTMAAKNVANMSHIPLKPQSVVNSPAEIPSSHLHTEQSTSGEKHHGQVRPNSATVLMVKPSSFTQPRSTSKEHKQSASNKSVIVKQPQLIVSEGSEDYEIINQNRVITKGTTEITFNLRDLNISKLTNSYSPQTTQFKFNLSDFELPERQEAWEKKNDKLPKQIMQPSIHENSSDDEIRWQKKKHQPKLTNKSKSIELHPRNKVGVEEYTFSRDNAAFIKDCDDDDASCNSQKVPTDRSQLVHKNTKLEAAWANADGQDTDELKDRIKKPQQQHHSSKGNTQAFTISN